jgi:hypothetical protein
VYAVKTPIRLLWMVAYYRDTNFISRRWISVRYLRARLGGLVGGIGAFSLARRPEKRRRRRNPYYPSPQISQISPPPQVEGKGEIAWVVAVVWGLTLVGKLGEWREVWKIGVNLRLRRRYLTAARAPKI